MAPPPDGIKDFNDWYRWITGGEGHKLGVRDRNRHGDAMLAHMLKNAVEIDGCEEIREENRSYAEGRSEQIKVAAMMLAFERSSGGPDMDFDVANTCATRLAFTKETEGQWIVWGGRVACSKWKCPACRQRVLIPAWQMRIITGLAGANQVFVVHLACDAALDLAKQLRALTRKATGQSADWAVIESGKDESTEAAGWEAAFLSTGPPNGQADRVFDLLEDEREIMELCDVVANTVATASSDLKRPVRTSRSLARCERPTFSDWLKKALSIAESRDALFVGTMEADEAKAIRSECRRRDAEGLQFITRDLPDGRVWMMTSHRMNDAQVVYIGPAATDAVRRGLKDGSAAEIKSSGRWRAKPTKGNERLDFAAGASEIRAAADELGMEARDIDIEGGKFVDAAGIFTASTDPDTQGRILAAVRRASLC